LAAGVALALPAAVGGAAVLTEEARLATGHDRATNCCRCAGSQHTVLMTLRATPANAGRSSRALVNPMVAPSEASEALITDGAHRRGNIVDAHPVADQYGKIAAADRAIREIGYVDCQYVHGDTAGDGTPLASDNNLRRRLAFGGAG